MTNATEQEYLSILDEIYRNNTETKKLQRITRKLHSKTQAIRAQYIIDIGTTKDEKGKPVYSNEHLREAELTNRLNNNPEYIGYRDELWAIDDKLDELYVENNKLVDIKYMLMIKLGIPFDEGAEKYPDIH